MKHAKSTITLLACCCIVLTTAPSASADFVGVTTVYPDDPDTEFQCTQGNGDFVPDPLTVCNVFAGFDNPEDRLLSVGSADISASNGAYYQHPVTTYTPRSPGCNQITDPPPFGFADLICDSFVTIGIECSVPDPGDSTATDTFFSLMDFNTIGHISGGWFAPAYGDGTSQGDAGQYPELRVLFLQLSVTTGASSTGTLNVFPLIDGEVLAFLDQAIDCSASCGSCPTDTDGDGETGPFDLAFLLGNWGPAGPDAECLDVDLDDIIGPFDLAFLLGNWGLCP